MIVNNGKKYSNPILTLLSVIVYNAKMFGLAFSIPGLLIGLEKSTSSTGMGFGDTEVFIWNLLLFGVSVLLFFIDDKWRALCDSIIDRFE